ncbi:MAG: 2-amino-4-hydroxy-6-hydroxymethyldihydropteridine diphosphokinase [Burkholderiaceae bacterium]
MGLGANLGDAQAALRDAIAALGRLPGTRVSGVSRLYRSAPVDAPGPDYVNAAVRLETLVSATDLLAAMQALESAAGRLPAGRHAPRVLDLDLLLYNSDSLITAPLTLPHPRLAERAFVLRPLVDIDPTLVLPDGRAVLDLLARLGAQRIAAIEPAPGSDA